MDQIFNLQQIFEKSWEHAEDVSGLSLFVRFVLILKVCVLENFFCPYF